MAIVRKPKISPERKPEGAVDINALIHKGGSAARAKTAQEEKPTPLLVRIPQDMLSRIDRSVKGRRIKTPRHTWILEAIVEKLEREADAS
jgi:hypothetical protein